MKKYNIFSILLLGLMLFSCNEETKKFENKAFINADKKSNTVLMKMGVNTAERIIKVSTAQPVSMNIAIKYVIEEDKVLEYNQIYSEQALILPSENYELESATATIYAGGTESTENKIKFKNLDLLDHEKMYVLPISFSTADVNILRSSQTSYYVLKGAALINVVANINQNYLSIDWVNRSPLNALSKLTMEALIRVNKFDHMISTVMGVEEKCLIRIGDAGFPSNQLQFVPSNGNKFPEANKQNALPTDEWIHVAVTYNGYITTLYVNGGKIASEPTPMGYVALASTDSDNTFYIGRSFSDSRYLDGEIAECRIWNLVRTQEEIALNPYYVNPNSEGLVAYWKFDDEDPYIVKDHSINGNHARASKPLEWIQVELPTLQK